jgi:hypothetical protein
MTAKQSSEMREALRLVRSGMSGSDAAIKAGVRRESLYRHTDYKAIRAARLAAAQTPTAAFPNPADTRTDL